MPYRIFSIPETAGASDDAAELNAFLHGHKIVAVTRESVADGASSRWSVGEKKAAQYGGRFVALLADVRLGGDASPYPRLGWDAVPHLGMVERGGANRPGEPQGGDDGKA